jgi:hypothetical protein
MWLEDVKMIAEPSPELEARERLNVVHDSVRACVQPRLKRERFRSVFQTLSLKVSLTDGGRVKALSGLPASMLGCVRESASRWQFSPSPKPMQFEATYIVEEFCEAIKGVLWSSRPCVPRFYSGPDGVR